jgi:thiosulfate/3-mercaptopyruvate sulfurtransferase
MGTSALIQADELASLLAGPPGAPACRPVLLDVRFRMSGPTGRREFERAHIPGASYVDLNTGLAMTRPDGVGGRHPMPTVETFTAAMRAAGVTRAGQVLVYDDWASLSASRLWWMLRHFGFLDVRVLDGGLAAWTAAGQPCESGPCTPEIGDFSPSIPGTGNLLGAADATRYADRRLLLDARPADRFRGENETIDAVAGHIPGALSAPALANVDPNGRFLPATQLAERLRPLTTAMTAGRHRAEPAGGARAIGTYCGSGVQATHLALALNIAGICDDADVYIGSWSDWITDPEHRVEVGPGRPQRGTHGIGERDKRTLRPRRGPGAQCWS